VPGTVTVYQRMTDTHSGEGQPGVFLAGCVSDAAGFRFIAMLCLRIVQMTVLAGVLTAV
jgi:hypothetical protein